MEAVPTQPHGAAGATGHLQVGSSELAAVVHPWVGLNLLAGWNLARRLYFALRCFNMFKERRNDVSNGLSEGKKDLPNIST